MGGVVAGEPSILVTPLFLAGWREVSEIVCLFSGLSHEKTHTAKITTAVILSMTRAGSGIFTTNLEGVAFRL